MADELSIRIGICTADQALGPALCRVLEGWAQVVCARFRIWPCGQAQPKRNPLTAPYYYWIWMNIMVS